MKFYRIEHCRIHEQRHIKNIIAEECYLCSATFQHRSHLKQHLLREHQTEIDWKRNPILK